MAWEARSREVLAMRVQLWPRILVRFWPYEPRFGQKYCDVMSWPWPRKKACLFELAWQMNYVGNTILLLGRGWSRWKDSVYSSFKSPSYRLQIWWIPKVFFLWMAILLWRQQKLSHSDLEWLPVPQRWRHPPPVDSVNLHPDFSNRKNTMIFSCFQV